MPPDPVAPPAPPAEKPRTAGESFFDKIISEPAKATELRNDVPPPPAPPAQVADPAVPAPPKEEKTAPEPPAPPKADDAGLEVPAKVTPKAADEKPVVVDPKADPAEPEPEETEDQFVARVEKLNKGDVLKIARKAFSQRTKAQQALKEQSERLKKLEKAEGEAEELRGKIKTLEEAPETKANLARLDKLQTDLASKESEIKVREEKIAEEKKYVEGLRFAHDVKSTPEYKQYVGDPSEELIQDIKMVSTTVGGSPEDSTQIEEAIKAALRIGDETSRWQALKEASANLSAADQARIVDIFKAHKQILKNNDLLTGQSDKARKTLDESRARKTQEEEAGRLKEYNEGVLLSRQKFTEEFPWVNPEFDISKYPEKFQDMVLKARKFADEIPGMKLSQGQRAKVDQGYVYYQAAAYLAREYSKELEAENTQIRANLQKYTDAEAAAAAAEAAKEKNKGELTPSAGPKNAPPAADPAAPASSRQVRKAPTSVTPSSAGAGFASMIMKGA